MDMPLPIKMAVGLGATALVCGALLLAFGSGPALLIDLAMSAAAFCL
ncbi:MAG: hypothetical protein AAFQ44_10905 [Pseudomonadota bacterium]